MQSCKLKIWRYKILTEELSPYDIYDKGISATFKLYYNRPIKMSARKYILEKSKYLNPYLVRAYNIFSDITNYIDQRAINAACGIIELLIIFSPYYHTNDCNCRMCINSKNLEYGKVIHGIRIDSIILPIEPSTITEINKILLINNYGDAIIFINELLRF